MTSDGTAEATGVVDFLTEIVNKAEATRSGRNETASTTALPAPTDVLDILVAAMPSDIRTSVKSLASSRTSNTTARSVQSTESQSTLLTLKSTSSSSSPSATITSAAATVASATPSQTTSSPPAFGTTPIKAAPVIGIACGIFAFVVVAILAVVIFFHKRQKPQPTDSDPDPGSSSSGVTKLYDPALAKDPGGPAQPPANESRPPPPPPTVNFSHPPRPGSVEMEAIPISRDQRRTAPISPMLMPRLPPAGSRFREESPGSSLAGGSSTDMMSRGSSIDFAEKKPASLLGERSRLRHG